MHVVAAAIVRDGRLLAALKPAGKRNGGLWELPGGKVEPGETEEMAIVREIREELGCEVRPVERLGEVEHDGVRLCGWRCELLAGEPKPLEHVALRWLLPSGFSTLAWAEADIPLLNALRSSQSGGLTSGSR